MINPFLNSERQLRNGWWILIFFLVLAVFLTPTLLIAQQNGTDVSIGLQAALILLASVICQFLRRQPLADLWGKINGRWLKELFLGGLIGSGLMLIPAVILWIFGWVDWQVNPAGLSALAANLLVFAGVAVAEEGLFRGFIFQRLVAGLTPWPAQFLLAGYFLLTHSTNPGMAGDVKLLASVNIFVASLLLGLAFLRTQSLAMPLGVHFMANMMQGGILGFGVSGNEQAGLLQPIFHHAPEWLTGGLFGLEASMIGLICVVLAVILLCRWTGTRNMSNIGQTIAGEL